MSKGPVLFLGIGVLGVLGLGCSSEGKIPFDDDELAPDDSAGQGGNAGASGSSGGSGASGRGGGAGVPTGGTAGSSAGSGGSSAGSGGSSAGTGGMGGSFGRGGTSSPGDPDTVGQSCAQASACESIPGGYCAKAGICTAECTTHVDCGCAPGTVNNDIAAGECSAACVTYDDGSSVCLRVCDSSGQCDGDTYCEELDFYGVCSPG